MIPSIKSIRPFIGARDYDLSRSFYRHMGFTESVISPGMSYFFMHGLGFYLQDYYAAEWVNNTMVFMEVDDVNDFWRYLSSLDLSAYEGAKLVPIRTLDWGSECFLHDPSGVLWHFGTFNK